MLSADEHPFVSCFFSESKEIPALRLAYLTNTDQVLRAILEALQIPSH